MASPTARELAGYADPFAIFAPTVLTGRSLFRALVANLARSRRNPSSSPCFVRRSRGRWSIGFVTEPGASMGSSDRDGAVPKRPEWHSARDNLALWV